MFKFLRRLILVLFVLFAGYKIYQVHHDVKQVMKYQTLVREVLDEQDTAANEELVLAMIYTETKGKDTDVMQSSESATGQTNAITDNKESIRQGVQTLSDNLELASQKKVDVWTAPSLGNVTGKTYGYYNLISIFHGPELYINGGNYYYSRQVKMNMHIMRLLKWF